MYYRLPEKVKKEIKFLVKKFVIKEIDVWSEEDTKFILLLNSFIALLPLFP